MSSLPINRTDPNKNDSWIRQYHNAEGVNLPVIIIFPHAGGSAAFYRDFSRIMSTKCGVIIMQYPGRHDRMASPVAESIVELAEGAFRDFMTSNWNKARNIIFFGHSMGAWVAYEFARLYARATSAASGAHLVVSAAIPPQLVKNLPPFPHSDLDIIAYMKLRGGTDSLIYSDEFLLQQSLTVLKADFAAMESYKNHSIIPLPHITCSVVGGTDDELVSVAELEQWPDTISEYCTVRQFPGDHFYFNNHSEQLAQHIMDDYKNREQHYASR